MNWRFVPKNFVPCGLLESLKWWYLALTSSRRVDIVLKSLNYSCHREKMKHLEADAITGIYDYTNVED